ncbi:hypothetical protein ACOSQ3_008297 [Xanthoceras sorbifolium]
MPDKSAGFVRFWRQDRTVVEMSSLSEELVFLILQFFNEEGLKRSAHLLERETGLYFDMKFFEEMVLDGNWEEVERYLSSFTKVDDNRYSTKIYFEIRKQNFLEALDSKNHAKALNILTKDLKVFAPGNEELFNEMTLLLTLDDIREHESLSMYGDTRSARKVMMPELKKVIEANPIFRGKLKFPTIKRNRLRRLINQSLNWQHLHCANPHANPDINTLFEDHVCHPPDDRSTVQLAESNALPSQASSVPIVMAGWNPNLSTLTDSSVSTGALSLGSRPNQATNMDGQEDYVMFKKMPFGILDEVTSTFTYSGLNHISLLNIPDGLPKTSLKNDKFQSSGLISKADLPKTVARILNEGSSPVSMDFHPVQHTFLLVGTNVGDIGLWDVNSGAKLLSRNFKVWNIGACSMLFQAALGKDPFVSVNRITWSPDGSLFGVAYSKHIAQLYSYHGGSDVRQKLEIDAHVGGINDLAFSVPNEQLLVITCGDDKTVKVWDVVSGVKMHSFEGHDAPVYSLCPHAKELIHFIFSTSVDGEIRAWLYDNMGARVDYDAPGLARTRMAYSADGRRLFSCGTNKDGESFLVEWDESEGSIKRTYQGLRNNSLADVQFGITKNQFLAAGDDHTIKIWDMDKVELLTTIDVDGGLPANPHICFNKEGTLLAVIANENRINILATDNGLQLIDSSESCSTDASRVLSGNLRELALNPTSAVASAAVAEGDALVDAKPDISGEADDKSRSIVGNHVIIRPSQCLPLHPPSYMEVNKMSRLIYNNAGNAILALASNGIHLLWKWPKDYLNLSGKATTKVAPQLWQPKSSLRLMINDVIGNNPEEAVPCFALSKNDSYLISASGGMISLFNMITFKTITNIMPPAPAATCLTFYPQDNNIIAIGMDDSRILIYHVRVAEVKAKLEGHSKRITGLAFSSALNTLVSSGADAQISVWNVDGWEKQKCRFWQMPEGKMPVARSDTFIQFHLDQTRFLVVHETQLAIYEAKELQCLLQWVPVGPVSISQATFSCDSQMVYAGFGDGTISVFDASNLELKCKVSSTSYLSLSSSLYAYPIAIAAHPQKPTQFAVGLTDGGVLVFEPQEPEGKWLVLPSDEMSLLPQRLPEEGSNFSKQTYA